MAYAVARTRASERSERSTQGRAFILRRGKKEGDGKTNKERGKETKGKEGDCAAQLRIRVRASAASAAARKQASAASMLP